MPLVRDLKRPRPGAQQRLLHRRLRGGAPVAEPRPDTRRAPVKIIGVLHGEPGQAQHHCRAGQSQLQFFWHRQMQKPSAEQRDRNQPTRLRAGPIQAGQADRRQAKREHCAGQPPAPLAKHQRERHRQQKQDHPGQRVRIKHVPVKPRAVHALDQLDRKLTHFGRRSRRQGDDLFFDFRRDGFARVPRLGRQRLRVEFAGLDLGDDVVARLLESTEFFDARIREV